MNINVPQLLQHDRALTSVVQPSPTPMRQRVDACASARNEADKKQETQMRACFDLAIQENLNIPPGYVTVAVLAIRWDDEADEYKDEHEKETSKLRELLVHGFGYTFEEKRLLSVKKPQHDLNAAIAEHLRKHDDPNSLLIIYYTGHGVLIEPDDDDDKRLALSASACVAQNKQRRPLVAFWHLAENLLTAADADVLVILDCCYASNASKGYSDDKRKFQLLAASPKDYTTPAPGKNSFTTRLINSLQELLQENKDRSFLITELVHRIDSKNRNSHGQPRGLPAVLHDRLGKFHMSGYIKLARLDNKAAERKQQLLDQQPPEEARLDFRFSLPNPGLSNQQIEDLAEQLPAAFKKAKVDLCRVDWLKFERWTPLALSMSDVVRANIVGRRWRRAISSSQNPLQDTGESPILEHMTSRDIMESPLHFSELEESTSLLFPKQSGELDKRGQPLKHWRKVLRYLCRKCAAILAHFRSALSKGSKIRLHD